MSLLFAQAARQLFFPKPASNVAQNVDRTFLFIFWVSMFFLALITVLLVYFAIKYRKKKGEPHEPAPHHNTPLELTWTIIPTILVVIMFLVGFRGYMDLAVPPEDSYTINVVGQKWKWLFSYPNGHIDEKLHVPPETNVRLLITSQDVIHSVYLPAFRVKMDAVPGRYTQAWFKAFRPGEYSLFCAEYCGTNHSRMITRCIVHPTRADFDDWLENADPLKRMTPDQFEEYKKDPLGTIRKYPELKGLEIPSIVGRSLYNKLGCTQCHSTDGTRIIGPSFLETARLLRTRGKRQFQDGTEIVVDENYIRESLLDPQRRIVAGYDGSMPSFQGRLRDREIYCLIEFIRSLAQ